MVPATHNESSRAPSGDLEHIFRGHARQVFAAAFRITGSAQDAEDVLQTVFLRLVRRPSAEISGIAGAYLHRAAVNASLDLMRSRSRSRSLPLTVAEDLAEDGAPDPSRHQESREMRGALRQAILQLPEKSAQIFVLRYLEGIDNRDIAQMMEMSQTAVAVSLHRARGRVKKDLRSFLGGS